MLKCSINSLNGIFAEIAKNATLYIPADNKDGKAEYTKWESGVELSNQLNKLLHLYKLKLMFLQI
mgnify:CR=1 FL=1